MKKTILVLVTAVVVALAVYGEAQGQGSSVFSGPDGNRRVTIAQAGVPVASVVVPAGAFVMASYDNQREFSISTGRWEFQGNVVLRVQPAATANLSQGTADQIWSNPPMVLTLSDVNVLVERVAP